MNRRSFLASSIGVSILSAGCLSSDHSGGFSFTVTNGSQDSHSIGIHIIDDGENTIFQDTFKMDGETANEDIQFDGIPSVVQVEIGSDIRQERTWPLESGDRVEQANVRYEPNLQGDDKPVYINTVIA